MKDIDIKYDDESSTGGREDVWKSGNDRNNQWAADANLIRHKNETHWERIRFCADQKDKYQHIAYANSLLSSSTISS